MGVMMVGCGNMGYAMLSAWIGQGALAAGETSVVEPADALRARAGQLGVAAYAAPDELPEASRPDLLVLAVKPQIMGDVLPAYRRFAAAGTAFLSIAAGLPIAFFEASLGPGTPVIRCMPNTPAAIGRGMMVCYANGSVTPETMAAATRLLETNGAVATINDEALMDAVTAVSGSGPAYVFHFIECLTEAGRAAGLPDPIAAELAMRTVSGAAELAATSDEAPSRLREQVTSPNGTTAAALGVLMGEDRLCTLVGEAVEAARLRSIELGK